MSIAMPFRTFSHFGAFSGSVTFVVLVTDSVVAETSELFSSQALASLYIEASLLQCPGQHILRQLFLISGAGTLVRHAVFVNIIPDSTRIVPFRSLIVLGGKFAV